MFVYGLDQIVILIASEDGTTQAFIKDKKDYIEPLKKEIAYFYKYFEEQNKDKVEQD